jgi:ABC-type nitrate/sulfonate/bicarbonate transport system permease component
MSRVLAPAVVLLTLLGAWEGVVRFGMVDSLLLPAPTEVARALWDDRAILAPDLLATTS